MAKSRSPWPEIMMTSMSGAFFLMRRRSSTPSMPGILMSARMMSGVSFSRTRKASSPLEAEVTP